MGHRCSLEEVRGDRGGLLADWFQRRRTQIRLAQRAYRQRKETTLDDLRKRVSELTNCLELMNKAFTHYRNNVSSLLSNEHQSELSRLSQEYEALMQSVRNPGEETVLCLRGNNGSRQDSQADAGETMTKQPQATNVPSWLDRSILQQAQKQTALPKVCMGYTMDPDPADEQKDDEPHSEPAQALSWPLQQPHSLHLSVDPVQAPPAIPQITTYSFQETTFARRLHRASLECAYYILLDSTRRRAAIEKIFQLPFSYGNTSRMSSMIKSILTRGTDESLEFSGAPPIHVGGAGTHFPRKGADGRLQPSKSPYNLGLVGLQTLSLLAQAAKTQPTTDMSCEIIGYEGEWFDPQDVEGYLEEKGIRIDPSLSFVEADIDIEPEAASGASSMPATPPLTSSHTGFDDLTGTSTAPLPFGLVETAESLKWRALATVDLNSIGIFDELMGDWASAVEPNADTVNSNNQSIGRQARFGAEEETIQTSFRGVQADTDLAAYTTGRAPSKRRVIIDVAKLVKGVFGLSGLLHSIT